MRSETSGEQANWALRAAEQLQLRSWDSGTVVYNGLSGDTHLLSPLAGDILANLKASATCEQLLALMPEHFPQEDRNESLGVIDAVLHELQAIDLVIAGGCK